MRRALAEWARRALLRRIHDYRGREMTDQPSTRPELDDAALAFAEQVFESTRKGDAARLADLLGRGLPPNIRNHNGDSLLMLASYHGHLDASRVLLENGADPQLHNDKGQSPLAGAAFKGYLDMARLLLDHGADVESATPDGKTALMMAAMFNRSEIVALLLERGADPARTDMNGVTPLAAAQAMGAQDTPKLLTDALAART
jgi:ankyrin repeat protein